MCLDVLSSSSASILLDTMLIPESTGLLIEDSVGDVTVTKGGACVPASPGDGWAAEAGCGFENSSSGR